jgi:hypothetical protein
MNDVIAPRRSSLRAKLVTTMMFSKLNMSLIPRNPVDVTESLIWNTLIPSRLELPNDINDPMIMKLKMMMMMKMKKKKKQKIMTMMTKMMIYH